VAERVDVVVIGGGPAGSAAAMRAARGGASVEVFESGDRGRDKICGDGLTPRAVAALNELNIPIDAGHRIAGLRMIAGRQTRELPWPESGRFPGYGAVWPRQRLDAALIEAAESSGAAVSFNSTAMPLIDDGIVRGVQVETSNGSREVLAEKVIVATGAPGAVARELGAVRVADEPFGLAIRTYVESPRHADDMLEACLTLRDEHGTPVPGYGWMFPCGDGTVNIGVGALSTMKGFKNLNLNKLLASYRASVEGPWSLGADTGRARAWRLPMSVVKRSGPGWMAIGDAAGLVNPMNGEGIDYGLESGMLAADEFLRNPTGAEQRYDDAVGERFDSFLRTGRRFAFLIGHPFLLRTGLRMAVGTHSIANITLQVMGNLVDGDTPGAAGRVLSFADRALGLADPLLRKTRAKA